MARPGDHEPGCEGQPVDRRSAIRVLVVDDHPYLAESLELLLKLSGYEALAVFDGATALEVASDFRPDVVLCDLRMPIMDGFEVARRLRLEPATRGALLIALSVYDDDAARRRSRAVGFDHHLAKPSDFDKLWTLLPRRPEAVGRPDAPGPLAAEDRGPTARRASRGREPEGATPGGEVETQGRLAATIMARSLSPMATAPKDGRPILVKPCDRQIYFSVAWDGARWVSGRTAVEIPLEGWCAPPRPSAIEGAADRPRGRGDAE